MATIGGLNYLTTNAATSGTITFAPYQYSQSFVVDNYGGISASPSKSRTNLDWLDERVNEMRVKL